MILLVLDNDDIGRDAEADLNVETPLLRRSIIRAVELFITYLLLWTIEAGPFLFKFVTQMNECVSLVVNRQPKKKPKF